MISPPRKNSAVSAGRNSCAESVVDAAVRACLQYRLGPDQWPIGTIVQLAARQAPEVTRRSHLTAG
jgi:hypothetical protein